MTGFPDIRVRMKNDALYSMLRGTLENMKTYGPKRDDQEGIFRLVGLHSDNDFLVGNSSAVQIARRQPRSVIYSEGAARRLDLFDRAVSNGDKIVNNKIPSYYFIGEGHIHAYDAKLGKENMQEDLKNVSSRMQETGLNVWLEIYIWSGLRRIRSRGVTPGKMFVRFPMRVGGFIRMPVSENCADILEVEIAPYVAARNGRDLVFRQVPLILPECHVYPPSNIRSTHYWKFDERPSNVLGLYKSASL